MKKLYFPHDFYASDDVKLQDVFMDLGAEGIGLYWMIIERLYRDGGILPLRNIRALAFNFRVKEDVITKLINDYGLFDLDENNFWSPSAVNRQKKIEELSEKRKSAINSRWGKGKEVDSNVIQMNTETDTNVLQLNKESIQTEYNCITNEQESDTNVIQIDTNAIQNDTTAIQTEYKSIQNKNKNKNKNKIDNIYNIYNAREEKNEISPDVVSFDSEEQKIATIKEDAIWHNLLQKRFHIEPSEVIKYIDEFALDCQCKAATHPTYGSLMTHFTNWLAKVLESKKNKESKQLRNQNEQMPIGMRGDISSKKFEKW